MIPLCPDCLGERGDDERSCPTCGGTGTSGTVIFDGPDVATVSVPHGVYTVSRSRPANNWRLDVDRDGAKASVEVGATDGTVRRLAGCSRFGVQGHVEVELLDVLVLAALAFRDRDETRTEVA